MTEKFAGISASNTRWLTEICLADLESDSDPAALHAV